MPKTRERRSFLRRPLMGELSGLLVTAADNRPVPCLAVDVSVSGMRILAREKIPENTRLVLRVGDQCIPLLAVWCTSEEGKADSFACGLVSTVEGTDLAGFLAAIGWLNETAETSVWLDNIEFVDRFDEE